MVVFSPVLKVNEVAFIVRVAIQVLGFGGTFLLTLIILGATPRVAPIETHDILNRIVGQATYTTSSLSWLVRRVRSPKSKRQPSLYLVFAIFLFLAYTLFVSLSDIGVLGFYECDIPFPDTSGYPASVASDQDARNLVQSNLLPNHDPTTIRSFRCDAATVHTVATNISKSICQSWHNSTFGESATFEDLNSTDSDIFMPRRMGHFERKGGLYTNSFVRRIEGARTTAPILKNGIAIEPHKTGVRVVAGVPHLSPNQTVVIPQNIAIEADVGCMSLGLASLRNSGGEFFGTQSLALYTNGTWRKYSGPDYLYNVLEKTVDEVRDLLRPLFNESDVNADGIITNYNTSSWLNTYTLYDSVGEYYLPGGAFQGVQILTNCSQRLHEQLGVVPPPVADFRGPDACSFLEIGGSVINGTVYQALVKNICATATQVNMVDATVRTDTNGTISLDLKRLPSTLNIVDANFWEVIQDFFGETGYGELDGILRYTLSADPNGPTSHFIYQENGMLGTGGSFVDGLGSSGYAISQLGSRMIHLKSLYDNELLLGTLDSHYYAGNFSVTRLTQWAGEMGASWALGSIGFNGWAARNLPELTIVSTGGKPATCFHELYGLALLPLFLAATITVAWMLVVLFRSPISRVGEAKEHYAGVEPYRSMVSAEPLPPGTLVLWEKEGEPHLQVVYQGQVVEGHRGETLAEYMKDKSLVSSKY